MTYMFYSESIQFQKKNILAINAKFINIKYKFIFVQCSVLLLDTLVLETLIPK
jgi:hypothetical protein